MLIHVYIILGSKNQIAAKGDLKISCLSGVVVTLMVFEGVSNGYCKNRISTLVGFGGFVFLILYYGCILSVFVKHFFHSAS